MHAMRKCVIALALSTATVAGSTIYFWRELAIERGQSTVPAALPVSEASPTPGNPSAAPESMVPVAADSPHQAPTRDMRSKEQKIAAAMIDARRQTAAAAPAFLASLDDPPGRAAMIADLKSMTRTYSAGLQRYLGLSDDAYDRFLDALAELELTGREAASRCALDDKCRFPNWDRSTAEARRRNALSQFGMDVADKYDFYQRSGTERQVVSEFRGRLDDATRLSDTQSDELVRALMEEHQRIREDLEKSPGNVGAINGVAYAEIDVGLADDDGADRSAEIADYNRRLRDVAASVLDAAQLSAFAQMQDEALAPSQEMTRMRRRQSTGAAN
jgi:hypothetical protein